jgi:hypothetical protein
MATSGSMFRGALVLGLASVLGACGQDSQTGATASTEQSLSTARELRISTPAARVRCVLRQGRRSKISVDGRNLSPAGGTFSARARSGANSVTAPAALAVGDEAEFDFDSNRNDIAQGATAVASNFIVVNAEGADVVGEIVNDQGTVVASQAVDCRVR